MVSKTSGSGVGTGGAGSADTLGRSLISVVVTIGASERDVIEVSVSSSRISVRLAVDHSNKRSLFMTSTTIKFAALMALAVFSARPF